MKSAIHTRTMSMLINKFTDFKSAEGDFEPDCLKVKYCEFIKLDLIEF